jgi:hypothetical protein
MISPSSWTHIDLNWQHSLQIPIGDTVILARQGTPALRNVAMGLGLEG